MGAFATGTTVHRETDDGDVQYKLPYGKLEPLNDDQQAFHRLQAYSGYLGQGGLRQVILPPDSKASGSSGSSGSLVQRHSDTDAAIGVFREQIGLDGSYLLETAHSLHLLKRSIIPVPKRLKLAEDATGDTAANYMASGKFGKGDAHKIGNPEAPDGAELPGLLTVAALLDLHAYLCNWKALHPFAYHKQDFNLPEEKDVQPWTAQDSSLTFADLLKQQWLTRPAPIELYVDHRYGRQKYYQATAGLSLLGDGNVVLRGGGGCALMMVNGNIRLVAPGNVFLEAGRDNVQISGYDSIVKAHNSIDVTAAHGDLRLKAEHNLEILAGNGGGKGRLLLENKVAGSQHNYRQKIGEDIEGSGILFKTKSQFVVWAQEVYVRTTDDQGGPGGDIVLDASQGQSDIRTISSRFIRHLDNAALDAFPAKSSEKSAVYSWTQFRADAQAALALNGTLTIQQGGAVINGDVDIA